MNKEASIFSGKHAGRIIGVILGLTILLGTTIDMVAPSLPSIAHTLHVPAASAKNVITLFLFGSGLGNFTIGFLIDAWGRQKLLRIVLIGFILSSLLPVIFPHVEILLTARFIQGFMVGGSAVISRAIFSDVSPPEKIVSLGILNSAMYGIGVVIGPFIGGYLQFYFGWQASFTFFSIMALILFIAIYMIVPETCFKRYALNIVTIKRNLAEVLGNKQFIALAIIMGSTYSIAIAFNTVGPFLIQTKLNYSPIFFGHIALILGLFFLCATFICRYLLKKYRVDQLSFVFIHGFIIITILAVIASYFLENNITLISVVSAIMFFAYGSIFPMSMSKGLSLFRHIAGTAVATMYLISILITSLTAFILSLINVQSSLVLFSIYLLLMAVCTFIYRVLLHKRLL